MPKSSSTKAAGLKKFALSTSVADAFFPQQDVAQAINYQSFFTTSVPSQPFYLQVLSSMRITSFSAILAIVH
jgi:hypothetical protein